MRIDQRFDEIARAAGDAPALIVYTNEGRTETTWSQLLRAECNSYRMLAEAEVAHNELVLLAMHDPVRQLACAIATWRMGRTPVFLPADIRPTELTSLLESTTSPAGVILVDSAEATHENLVTYVIGDAESGPSRHREGETRVDGSIPTPGWLVPSGGTSGVPKLAARHRELTFRSLAGAPLLLQRTGWKPGVRQLITGALCHTAPLHQAVVGVLFGSCTVVVTNPTLDTLTSAFITDRPLWAQLTPYQLSVLASADLAVTAMLRGVLHTGARCPENVKREWIARLGPERIHETYAASEGIGTTLIGGNEWLERPGSVGRGFFTNIQIRSGTGETCGTGEVGTIYMKSTTAADFLAREVASVNVTPDGFASVGDLGRLDEEGYLYLADRRDDLIIYKGRNMYPQEIEDILCADPAVVDAAVVAADAGPAGSVPIAFVEVHSDLDSAALIERRLGDLCRRNLSRYKVPRRFEVMTRLPRTAAGKVARAELKMLLVERPSNRPQ